MKTLDIPLYELNSFIISLHHKEPSLEDPITHSLLQYLVRTLIPYWEYMALLPSLRGSPLNPYLVHVV